MKTIYFYAYKLFGILKVYRLKVSSSLSILADALMGLSGASGLYHLGHNNSDLLLAIGGGLGLVGHITNVIWGTGGKVKQSVDIIINSPQDSLLKRVLFPWRYPLDSSFAIFSIGSLLFALAGFLSETLSLVIFGMLTLVASMIGWLVPSNKNIFNLTPIQLCAFLYMLSSISCMISGIAMEKELVLMAGLSWFSANVILFTIKKEHQSSYTSHL